MLMKNALMHRRRMKLHLVCVVVAGLVDGCAGPNLPGSDMQSAKPVVIRLNATTVNAGEIGRASLVEEDGTTRISLNFSGVPVGTVLPVHVYTYVYEGACDKLPEEPAYSLNDHVLVTDSTGRLARSRRGAFTLSHSAPVAAGDLLSGRFALALRTAPADGDRLIYCGDLRKS